MVNPVVGVRRERWHENFDPMAPDPRYDDPEFRRQQADIFQHSSSGTFPFSEEESYRIRFYCPVELAQMIVADEEREYASLSLAGKIAQCGREIFNRGVDFADNAIEFAIHNEKKFVCIVSTASLASWSLYFFFLQNITLAMIILIPSSLLVIGVVSNIFSKMNANNF